MALVSLIVPCYNEEANVRPFYEAIVKVFARLPDANFELIFIDDGSRDNTFENIQNLHDNVVVAGGGGIKCISFSRNFGKEAAVFSGLRAATGDCSVILDVDLQHPPEVIIDMYEKWAKEKYEVVEGIKTDRGEEGVVYSLFTKLFYALISKAVGMNMKDSSDYKLLDRKVVNALAGLKERNTFFRALSFWMGFKKTEVYYEVQERQFGSSKWSSKSLIRYAINNVICFSYAPLQIVTGAGIAFLLIAVVFGVDALISYIRGTAASGFPTLIFIMAFGIGMIMISLGIIGGYIAQIYDEVKGRPQYIVREKIDG